MMLSILDKSVISDDMLVQEVIAITDFYAKLYGNEQTLIEQAEGEAYEILADIAKEQIRRDQILESIRSRVDRWRETEAKKNTIKKDNAIDGVGPSNYEKFTLF